MVADGLILKDDLDDTIRIVTYGEFYNTYFTSKDNPTRQYYDVKKNISYLFINFHPENHPVLWRILIAQAHIYRLIMHTYATNDGSDISSKMLATLIQGDLINDFDWRQEQRKQDISADKVFEEPFDAVREYIQKVTVKEYQSYSRSLPQPKTKLVD